MALPIGEVNWLAVVVGGIIPMVTGFVWYGPLFGKTWMRLSGISQEQVDAGPGLGYLWSFIAALVSATVLSLLIISMGSTSLAEGVMAGVLVAVGFVATSSLANNVFEGKHIGVWALFAAYQIITLAIVGGVLAVWR